jgi:hypothetical protein
MDSLLFAEPFTFSAALVDDHPLTVTQGPAHGALQIGGGWWGVTLLDDVALYRDVRDPTRGTLPDIPSAPLELAAWLRSNWQLEGSQPTTIEIDGRTAVRFGKTASHDGVEPLRPAGPDLGPDLDGAFYHLDFVYLLSTPRDTIVVAGRGDMDADTAAAEELIRSITFR